MSGSVSGTAVVAPADVTLTIADDDASPVFAAGTVTARSVAENTAASTAIGAAFAASDADSGDTVSYALEGTDAALFAVGASDGMLKFKASPDYEAPGDDGMDNGYAVTVKASDPHGNAAELAVTVTVTNVDEAGSVTFGTATPAVGTAFTASVEDPDGSVSAVTWQWSRSDTQGGTYADISGATSASYTPVGGDAGKWLRASAGYTDGEGSGKSAQAEAANAVDDPRPNVTGALAVTSDPGSDGTYATGDVLAVTVTFDEAIAVTGTPQLTVKVGTADKTATCARKGSTGEAAKKLVCSYTIADGDADTDGVSVEANKLTLPSGASIKDASDVAATLTHEALAAQSGHKVDGVKPTVTAGSTGYYSDAALSTRADGAAEVRSGHLHEGDVLRGHGAREE